MKYKTEKEIRPQQMYNLAEKKNRRFKMSYVQQNSCIRKTKVFKEKNKLLKYLNDPENVKIRLYVCEVE